MSGEVTHTEPSTKEWIIKSWANARYGEGLWLILKFNYSNMTFGWFSVNLNTCARAVSSTLQQKGHGFSSQISHGLVWVNFACYLCVFWVHSWCRITTRLHPADDQVILGEKIVFIGLFFFFMLLQNPFNIFLKQLFFSQHELSETCLRCLGPMEWPNKSYSHSPLDPDPLFAKHFDSLLGHTWNKVKWGAIHIPLYHSFPALRKNDVTATISIQTNNKLYFVY